MKKFHVIIILIIVAIAVIIFTRFVMENPEMVKNNTLIGGDKDNYDCLIAAGYSWCPSTEKCQRMWEEYCEEYKEQFKGEVVDCQSFEPDECPSECVVCPPCPACSSISCQTEEFCESMGINRNWYDNIKEKMKSDIEITSFEDCVRAGNPILESHPRRCVTANGIAFIESVKDDKSDMIRLDLPEEDEMIESPLKIKGEARGTWFFEGDFPVVLTNWDGLIIAEGYATANPPAGGDWMTENFVPFEAELEFTVDTSISNQGSLILKKDNPSGLTENDDTLEVSVVFK